MFDLLDYLKRVFKGTAAEGLEEVGTPQHEDAAFMLKYESLLIGYLRLHEGLWEFRYSDEFRHQFEVKPIVGFPNVERTYVSKELWPFFMARIPSLAQPQVREFVDRVGLDEHNSAALLRAFGSGAFPARSFWRISWPCKHSRVDIRGLGDGQVETSPLGHRRIYSIVTTSAGAGLEPHGLAARGS